MSIHNRIKIVASYYNTNLTSMGRKKGVYVLNGKSTPSTKTLIKLVKHYPCSLDWLILGFGEPQFESAPENQHEPDVYTIEAALNRIKELNNQ